MVESPVKGFPTFSVRCSLRDSGFVQRGTLKRAIKKTLQLQDKGKVGIAKYVL